MIATATLPMAASINANAAGAPLPILPRRSTSASRISFPSSTPQKPIKLVVQHATPPSDGESSSTSTSSDGPVVAIRSKRVRGVRAPADSTPLPAIARRPIAIDDDETPRPMPRPTPVVYTPGKGTSLRALSTSHLPTLSPPTPKTTTTPDQTTPRIIRKKSGEPLKSSLKSSTPKVRGSLEVVINPGAGSSKSAPSTPTASRMRVHFNSQLEQVKLFLAEQKPLAVSRDGSPTEDTSGTEDFPDFVFGRDRAREDEGVLEMYVNVPPPEGELDVKLQTLALDGDRTSVAGTVAVRNLSFDKWVAVRFTLDDWQTTSEVTARYSHSLPGGIVDVFAFNIRLADLLARIDGKHMSLAVRYHAAGKEMWDNNAGRNYSATFKRVRAPKKEGEVAADLRSRLERVVNTQDDQQNPPLALRGDRKSAESPAAIGFRTGGSLAARYDFNASAKAPWRPHQRAASHPNFASPSQSPSPPNTVPWPRSTLPQKPRVTLGSPRDASEDGAAFRPASYVDSENQPFSIPKPSGRNHQRGYFDMPLRESAYGSSNVRRTPPGTPRVGTPLGSPGRYNSYPPLDPRASVGLGIAFSVRREDVSEDSTPSFMSSEGSSRSESGTTSPVSPPDFVAIEARLGLDLAGGADPSTYHSFLDKFCFYTGSGTGTAESLSIPRTQSASSVEELLSVVSASPRLRALVSSPATGDGSSSGSSTPTSTSAFSVATPTRTTSSVFSTSPVESRAPTPVAA